MDRGREINLTAAVNKDTLTRGLRYSIATGNWGMQGTAGLRAGVSQVVIPVPPCRMYGRYMWVTGVATPWVVSQASREGIAAHGCFHVRRLVQMPSACLPSLVGLSAGTCCLLGKREVECLELGACVIR